MSLGAVNTIQQGHRYTLNNMSVIALGSGSEAQVMYFREDKPWLGLVVTAFASDLTPEPMRYFHGQLPS